MSLLRVFLTPVIGYFLWKGDIQSTHICVLLLIVAALTDGLDGYLARRFGQVSELGKGLDPLADKLMASFLIVLLVLFRDFPFWLAGIVVSRDVVILLGGLILFRGKKLVVPSNLAGKYTFASIAFLIVSYIYRFPFGIHLTTWLTIFLVGLSSLLYVRVFFQVKHSYQLPISHDRPVWKALRIIFNVSFLAVYFYSLIRFLDWW
ncbi:MAG: CDP-alcohol phosphatidyltransferase family protein [candidate division Zixibacteria bacterium]|nr:CDP-alcohol phosphatidyltransferase family protein [candidate division Zixibacteria bacterium]